MSKPAFVFDGRMILDVDKLKQIGFTVSILVILSAGLLLHSGAAFSRTIMLMRCCVCR